MIDFTTVTHHICIFYLGGVIGDEGPLLNILKISDNRYYFDYFIYDTDLSPNNYQDIIDKLKAYQKDKPTCSNT